MSTTVDAYWLPPDLGIDVPVAESRVERGEREVVIRWPLTTPALIRAVCAHLRERREAVLQRRPVAEIVASLDRVAEAWLDPDYAPRRLATAAISVVAGFSEPMVGHAIQLEQTSSRAGDLLATLDGELGDHTALDGFVRTPKGRATAVGPPIVGGIFSANIPALPHLTVMRSFLVKAACLGRVSRGEPVYLPLYARSIQALDPELASCLAVLHWPAADRACEQAFFDEIDHLIAYGSDGTLSELRARLPTGVGATWHGHRMGLAYIGRAALDVEGEALDALADRIAYDFTVFDQHACLAPQACFVERGGRVGPGELAERVAAAMARWLVELPPRALSVSEAATLRGARDLAALRAMMGAPEAGVFTPPDQLQGTVVVTRPGSFEPSPLDRFARIVPVDGPADLLDYLRPVARSLQCAAVAGATDALRLALARLGVTRICRPGSMGTPSMLWRHDGRPCVEDLVRWCDEELVAPG